MYVPSLDDDENNFYAMMQNTPQPIGNFDFECPNTKFLVVSMTRDAGLGAHMRLGALNALVAGVATNRTVLLLIEGDKCTRNHGLMRCVKGETCSASTCLRVPV
jgi:hypothetical protein